MGLLRELGYFAEQNQNLIRAVVIWSGFTDNTLGSLRSSLFRFLPGKRKSREGSGTEVTKN